MWCLFCATVSKYLQYSMTQVCTQTTQDLYQNLFSLTYKQHQENSFPKNDEKQLRQNKIPKLRGKLARFTLFGSNCYLTLDARVIHVPIYPYFLIYTKHCNNTCYKKVLLVIISS